MFNNKMPNPKFCGPHDDMNFVNCDLTKSYKTCQPSEKLCHFAYSSWCPVCDLDTHRRRSKSECIESHYRKRGRDMKTPSPKKKDTYRENDDYLNSHDSKLHSTRVRTNLCELPTTYIDNCQTNVPSNVNDVTCPVFDRSHQKHLPDTASGRMNTVKNGDFKKLNGCNKFSYSSYSPTHNKMESFLDGGEFFDPKISCKCHHGGQNNLVNNFNQDMLSHERDISNIKQKIRQAVRNHSTDINTYKHLDNPTNLSSPPPSHNANTYKYLDNSSNHQNPPSLTVVKQLVANENFPTRKLNAIRRQLPSPIPKSPNKHLFNQKAQDDFEKSPKEHYEAVYNSLICTEAPVCNESHKVSNNKILDHGDTVSSVDTKRHKIRQRSESETSNDIPAEKPLEVKKAREVLPLEHKKEIRVKNVVKVPSSIKTRHKLSAIKLRKVRNKIAHSVSSDSNLSDSDFIDTDAEEEKTPTETINDVFPLPSSDNLIGGSTPIDLLLPAGYPAENLSKWPVRSSLFPFIPPYIYFSSHDAEQPFKLPTGASRFLKWRLSTITPVVVRKTLTNTGFKLVRSEYQESNDWVGVWGKHMKSACFTTLKEHQKLNHFPGTFQIGRKDRLWKNLQRLMFKFGMKEFGFIPRTFILPIDLKLLRQAWEKTGNEKWIIKPPASARGTGIRVIHRWSHLPKKKSVIVQQYISNPYLINGSKFDLRLYVLVTSFNPLRIYLYPEGLARFASTKYSDDLSTLSDRYMHLTNYSINKLSSQYTANEDANACKGHKWTLSKLWEYLEKTGVNTKVLWRNLQQLVIKTILCGEPSINQLYKSSVNSRYNCYELFGIDVLLDERLKPWLLEVNISPSLHSASPLDLHVKGPMVQTLLNLAQFHLPPKVNRLRNSPASLNCDLYSVQLTSKERLKHLHFTEFEKRDDYLTDILVDLTGDDIRHLTQAEDELTVIGNFERVFPTQHSHIYFQFMEPRYYNRLFDAWETRYEKNRTAGIKLLQSLCEKKLHLVVAPTIPRKLSTENDQESTSTEVSVSDDSTKTNIQRPQPSPIPTSSDPLNNSTRRSKLQYKILAAASSKIVTPI